jgi:hypothetical protein
MDPEWEDWTDPYAGDEYGAGGVDPSSTHHQPPDPDLHDPDLHDPDLHDPDLHDPDLHDPDLHDLDLHDPDLHGLDSYGAEPFGTDDAVMPFDHDGAASAGVDDIVAPDGDGADEVFGADPDTLGDLAGLATADAAPDPAAWFDVPDLSEMPVPEPVDGPPWSDADVIGNDATPPVEIPLPHGDAPVTDLLDYSAAEADEDPWSTMRNSEDPAGAALARWWGPAADA